jgi:hypothetical protein
MPENTPVNHQAYANQVRDDSWRSHERHLENLERFQVGGEPMRPLSPIEQILRDVDRRFREGKL